MFTQEEHFYTTAAEEKIYYRSWTPSTKYDKILIITHGQGEHSGSYSRVIDFLEDTGYKIYAWDLAGHGRSYGKRGYVKKFSDHIQNFIHIINEIHSSEKRPIQLLGHSMGGLIQLAATADKEFPKTQIHKMVFSAPFLDVATPVPFYKDLAAIIIGGYLPKLTLPDGIENSMLSQDPIIHLEYNRDVYRHHWMSSSVYLGVIENSMQLRAAKKKFHCPTLFQIPQEDPVVSSSVTRAFVESLHDPQLTLKEYPNRKHEIYNDIFREEPLGDLKEFLLG